MGKMKDFGLSIETTLANNPKATDFEIAKLVVEDCKIDLIDLNYVINNIKRYRMQMMEEDIKP